MQTAYLPEHTSLLPHPVSRPGYTAVSARVLRGCLQSIQDIELLPNNTGVVTTLNRHDALKGFPIFHFLFM